MKRKEIIAACFRSLCQRKRERIGMKDNNRIMENQELLDYVGGYINAFEVGFPIYKNRLAEKLQKDFGIGKKDSTVIATVAFDKIMDTGKISNLRLYRKGIYYRTESTPFGELGINKEQLIADKYLVPDIGYETGFTVLHRMGLTTQMPVKRSIVSNAVTVYCLDRELDVEVYPPRERITDANKLYFQLLDALNLMEQAPIDAIQPYVIIANHIVENQLQYDKLLAYSEHYYGKATSLKLALAVRQGK